ncbi:MAG: AMP-binding protein [Bacteroidales bacterium]|nr:AMP-binding protein [Bacteroidales bacterium]
MATLKEPWIKSYGEVPFHLNYSEKSLSGVVLDNAEQEPGYTALSFMGRSISYGQLAENIDKTARAFYNIGVRKGQRVLVCMPNAPQAIYCLYALNRIGAVAAMVHPLSAIGEIVFYLNEAQCDVAITLDQFYAKFTEVGKQRHIGKLIITRMSDELPAVKAFAYKLLTERKFPKIETGENVMMWKDFIKNGENLTGEYCDSSKNIHAEAVVLFSGGTTGTSKGIMLSDYNFNALAAQTCAMCHKEVYHSKMLAAMPVFHGFGLGVCIHTMMFACGTSILVPKFNVKSYAKLIKDLKPNFIAGVPTLFEAIVRNEYLAKADLSCLRGVFSGGDSLTIELKKKFDDFLESHNADIHVREGYGTTECVTASCLTPYLKEKEGSIGLPYPDTYYRICKPGTEEELPYGQEGEICLSGPSVMIGYIGHAEENANTLHKDEDGRIWLHTGDLGTMDDEGYIYFKQRLKRMIVTSGYNVYPSQIENILEGHPAVRRSCVIGVPDPYKMQKVKAFVVLEDGCENTPELIEDIMSHCRKRIAKYAMPYVIEVRESLPTTLVGKVAYTKLQ